VEEERLEDAYQTIAKSESKNLMFIELLTYLVEKGFVRNEHKVDYFLDLYERIKMNRT
jgi:methionine salvage enolase-phosphatase E1